MDGINVGSSAFNFVNKPAHYVFIGGNHPGADIDGYISDVRVWDYARTEQEIKATMQHSLTGQVPGLLACWPLDEGSGATAHDITFAASNGELQGHATWSDEVPPPGSAIPNSLFVSSGVGLYGTVIPPYGVTSGLAHNDSFECSAAAGYQYHPRDNRYRATCSGYSIITNRAAPPLLSGNTTTFTYLHDSGNPFTLLQWQWDVEYETLFAATANGSVSTPGGWSAADSLVTVTAVPDDTYHFTHWSGDVPQGQEQTQTLSFIADHPRSITAHFSEVYYVKPDGNDAADGRSWATARETIQAAVDVAEDDNLVLVADGVYDSGGALTPGYSITNRVTVTNAITIRSASGDPARVTIVGAPDPASGDHGPAAIRCLYLDGGARIAGVTLTGGYTHTNLSEVQYSCGGGAFINNGSIVSNCVVATNSAAWHGGGIACFFGGEVTHSLVATNLANHAGGGIYNHYGGKIESSRITRNRTLQSAGGGIYHLAYPGLSGQQPGYFSNLIVDNNYSQGTGGGVNWDRGHCILSGSLISNNVARGGSGGVYAWGNGIVTNCIITHNRGEKSNTGSGGIYLYSDATVTHSIISDNYTTAYGGGVFNRGKTVNNCLIVRNRALLGGGGIWVGQVNGGINKNCTIVDNVCDAAGRGGGMDFNTIPQTLQNCIVWDNTPANIYHAPSIEPTITYTCTTPLEPGLGNINADPRLVNPARGNYHLGSGSLCIDSGLFEAWMATGGDLDGRDRIRGSNVDRGCYEYFPQQTLLLLR